MTVIVIGFDAAEPTLVDRWIEEGHLPNLARMRAEGASGRINSTMQPISPAAWSTIVTGMNPGGHGVYDWYERDATGYHQQIVTSRSIKAPAVWDRANRAGRTAGVFNVPLSYPAQPLDGWLVTGILSPPGAQNITYPPDLRPELDVDGRYKTFFGATYAEGDEPAFIESLHETLEQRGKTLLHLMRTHPTDLLFAVFMESDHVMHYFWKYMDATHPSHRPEHEAYQHTIRDVYARLDRILGEVLAQAAPDDTVIVLSDHGSSPQYGQLLTNKLLLENGLLALERRPGTRVKLWLGKNRVAERVYGALRAVGIDLRPLVSKKVRQLALNSGISREDIDWSKTVAYASGDMGYISINVEGREGQGAVDPRDREEVIERVIAVLREVRGSDGEPLVDHIWRATALYHGPHAEDAPDIVFTMRGLTYTAKQWLGLHVPGVIQYPRFGRIEISGTHSQYGIFYAVGPHVKAGEALDDLDLTQVAPTILYSMGLPVPNQLDGRVIEAMVDADHLQANPVQYVDEADLEKGGPAAPSTYTGEEEKLVEERLRNLGYLD